MNVMRRVKVVNYERLRLLNQTLESRAVSSEDENQRLKERIQQLELTLIRDESQHKFSQLQVNVQSVHFQVSIPW